MNNYDIDVKKKNVSQAASIGIPFFSLEFLIKVFLIKKNVYACFFFIRTT